MRIYIHDKIYFSWIPIKTLVEQLKKIADHENRSLTNLIETELKRIAENHSIIEQGKEKEKMNFGITANVFGLCVRQGI